MTRTSVRVAAFLALGGISACSRAGGSASCGLDALTGPLAVKQSFAEGHMLTSVPDSIPPALPVRLVAGPAWRATIEREGTDRWNIKAHGPVSREAFIGYGVLVVDDHGIAAGVFAFDGYSIRGGYPIGTLAIGDTVVPLLGVRLDPALVQTPQCPAFPDSLR